MGSPVKVKLASGRYLNFDSDQWTPDLNYKIQKHTSPDTYKRYRALMQTILPSDKARMFGTPVPEPDKRGFYEKLWQGSYSKALGEIGVQTDDKYDVKEPVSGVDYNPDNQAVMHYFGRPVVVGKGKPVNTIAAMVAGRSSDEYVASMNKAAERYEPGSFANNMFRVLASSRDSMVNAGKGALLFAPSVAVSAYSDAKRVVGAQPIQSSAIRNTLGDEEGDVLSLFDQGKEFIKFAIRPAGAVDPVTGDIERPSIENLVETWVTDPWGSAAGVSLLAHTGSRLQRGTLKAYRNAGGKWEVKLRSKGKLQGSDGKIESEQAARARTSADLAEEAIAGKAADAINEVIKDMPEKQAVSVLNTALELSEAERTFYYRYAPESALEFFEGAERVARIREGGQGEYIFENDRPFGVPEFVDNTGAPHELITRKSVEVLPEDLVDATLDSFKLGPTGAARIPEPSARSLEQSRRVTEEVQRELPARMELPESGPMLDIEFESMLPPTDSPISSIPMPEAYKPRIWETIDSVNEQLFPDRPGELLNAEMPGAVIPKPKKITQTAKAKKRTNRRTNKRVEDDIKLRYNNLGEVPYPENPIFDGPMKMYGGPPVEQLFDTMKKVQKIWEDVVGERLYDYLIKKPEDWVARNAQRNDIVGLMTRFFTKPELWQDTYTLGQLREVDRQLRVEGLEVKDIVDMVKGAEMDARTYRVLLGEEKPVTEYEANIVKSVRGKGQAWGFDAVKEGILNFDTYQANKDSYLPRLFDVHESKAFGDINIGRHMRVANIVEIVKGRRGNSLKTIGDRFRERMPILNEAEAVEWRKGFDEKINTVRNDNKISLEEKVRRINRIKEEQNAYIPEEWYRKHRIESTKYSLSKMMQVKHDVLVHGAQRNIYNNPELSLEGRLFNKALYGEQPGKYSRRFTKADVEMELLRRREMLKTEKKGTPGHEIIKEQIRKHEAALAEHARIIKENADYYQKVGGAKEWGWLGDTHLPAHVIEGIREASMGMGLAHNILSAIIRPWKTGKTVLNPSTHSRNVMWNMYAAWMADVSPLNMKVYAEAKSAIVDRNSEYYTKIREWGLTDSGMTTEMMQTLAESLNLRPGRNQNIFTKLTDLARNRTAKASDIYAFEESLFKAAVFINEVKRGTTERVAAEKALKYLFDYNEVSRATKWMRVMPVVGAPFGTFHAKLWPLMLETAIMKPWKLLPMLALPAIINQLAEARFGEEEVEDARKARAPWEQKYFAPMAPWGDNPSVFNMSSIFPVGDLDNASGGIFRNIPVLSMIPPGLQPIQEPVGRGVIEMAINKTFLTGREVFDEDASAIDKTRQKFDYAYKQAMPPLSPEIPLPYPSPAFSEGGYSYQKIKDAAMGREDYFGAKRGIPAAVADTVFGIKSREIDAVDGIGIQVSQKERRIDELESLIDRVSERNDYSEGKKKRVIAQHRRTISRLKNQIRKLSE